MDAEIRRLTGALHRSGLDPAEIIEQVLAELHARCAISHSHRSEVEDTVISNGKLIRRVGLFFSWEVRPNPLPRCPTCSGSRCVYAGPICPALNLQPFDPLNPPPTKCEVCKDHCYHQRPQRA